jgi:uncharacterized phage-associated protein
MMSDLRFKFDHQKCVQAIQFLAENMPEITQYYVGKVMFFADKEHLLDWGRPIYGDRYVAMEHGPVPSNTYNIIKGDSGEPDEVSDLFSSRISVRQNGNKKHLTVRKGAPPIDLLTHSDKEALLRSLQTYGKMPFGKIKEISHKDISYEQAWSKDGLNNEMNLRLWLNADQAEYVDQTSSVKKAIIA